MKNKPLVFLVEDDSDDQYIFEMVVKELSIDVDIVVFDNGLAAYQALAKTCNSESESFSEYLPDLMILDLNLPVWDGKKTLTEVKKDQRLKKIPIIIYTTSKSEYDVSDCYQLGANSFVSKAPEYSKLQQQIKDIFGYWLTTVTL